MITLIFDTRADLVSHLTEKGQNHRDRASLAPMRGSFRASLLASAQVYEEVAKLLETCYVKESLEVPRS